MFAIKIGSYENSGKLGQKRSKLSKLRKDENEGRSVTKMSKRSKLYILVQSLTIMIC